LGRGPVIPISQRVIYGGLHLLKRVDEKNMSTETDLEEVKEHFIEENGWFVPIIHEKYLD